MRQATAAGISPTFIEGSYNHLSMTHLVLAEVEGNSLHSRATLEGFSPNFPALFGDFTPPASGFGKLVLWLIL